MKKINCKRNIAKFLFLTFIVAIVINVASPITIYATTPSDKNHGESVKAENLVNTPEELEELRNKGIDESPFSLNLNSASSSGFVSGFSNFRVYYTSNFYQYNYNTNCTPTLAANVLSYFQTARGVQLNAGNITQELYDQICTDVNYNPATGSNLDSVADGLRTWASRYGKTAEIDEYWLNSWSDVTRDIDANKPIMLEFERHAYLILGYKVENGTQYIYACTGWDTSPFQWLEFSGGVLGDMKMQSVNIY